MDYAKYACIKAEELEARFLRTAANEQKRNVRALSFYPHTAPEGGYAPCTVAGGGTVGVTVSLALYAPQGVQECKIRLYCADLLAAYTTVTVETGAYARVTLPASVTPGDGEKLRVSADKTGLLLEEMHVLVDGDGVTVTAATDGYGADCLNASVYLARERNGTLYVRKCGTDTEINVAHASVFDICTADGEVHVLCSDDVGNLWGVSYDADLCETNRVHLGEGMDGVAVGCNPSGWILAGCKNGKLYLAQCGSRFSGRTDWECAAYGAGADAVYLSKQSQNAVLFFRKDGIVYAKLPLPASHVRECVTVALGLEIL